MSAADCDCPARATPCPAHIESASISPVVPAIGTAQRAAHQSGGATYLAPGLTRHLGHDVTERPSPLCQAYDVGIDSADRRSQPWNFE